jgi:hypothetical protein
MLAAAPSVLYIHEPFKPVKYRPGICSARFDHWFTFICSQNEASVKPALLKTINLQYNWQAEVRTNPGLSNWRKVFHRSLEFRRYRQQGLIPLLKEPIALFSAEWLAQTFDMNVLVLIRHPAAFVSSLKRLNWEFPFVHFMEQPLLMKARLAPFAKEISRYSEHKQDIIEQACLLWRILYYVVWQYQQQYAHSWLFWRHEDISRESLTAFADIFNRLGLDFTPAAANINNEHSLGNGSTPLAESKGLKRNSRSNIWQWRERLTPAEISLIRHRTEDVAYHFYSADDW